MKKENVFKISKILSGIDELQKNTSVDLHTKDRNFQWFLASLQTIVNSDGNVSQKLLDGLAHYTSNVTSSDNFVSKNTLLNRFRVEFYTLYPNENRINFNINQVTHSFGKLANASHSASHNLSQVVDFIFDKKSTMYQYTWEHHAELIIDEMMAATKPFSLFTITLELQNLGYNLRHSLIRKDLGRIVYSKMADYNYNDDSVEQYVVKNYNGQFNVFAPESYDLINFKSSSRSDFERFEVGDILKDLNGEKYVISDITEGDSSNNYMKIIKYDTDESEFYVNAVKTKVKSETKTLKKISDDFTISYKDGSKIELLNTVTHKPISHILFDNVFYVNNVGVVMGCSDDIWMFIDKNGLDFGHSDVRPTIIDNDFAYIKYDDVSDCINFQTKSKIFESTDIVYSDIHVCHSIYNNKRTFCITVDGKDGIVDSDGELIMEPIFDKIHEGYSDNRFVGELNGQQIHCVPVKSLTHRVYVPKNLLTFLNKYGDNDCFYLIKDEVKKCYYIHTKKVYISSAMPDLYNPGFVSVDKLNEYYEKSANIIKYNIQDDKGFYISSNLLFKIVSNMNVDIDSVKHLVFEMIDNDYITIRFI